MARLPMSLRTIGRLWSDIAAGGGEHVLAVGGAREHAHELRQQFLRGRAEPSAVRLGGPEGADAYVHVFAGDAGETDLSPLRRARRARVPAVAVVRGSGRDPAAIPYVLATDIVRVDKGEPFPLEAIAQALAARLGERGAPLAARLPLLHGPVCERLVESFSRRNGLFAAAGWTPGADLPVLALNDVRLVLRLAQAHGSADEALDRLPELAATISAGLVLRALARELLRLVPTAGWAVKGAVAYGGTRAVGEAARLRFELVSRPPRGAASPAAL
jgi:uncharacterized protein (DUF697 family)